jgi:hypothetical protein
MMIIRSLVYICAVRLAAGVCEELTQVLNVYDSKYDSLPYTQLSELALGCSGKSISKNPFFPSVTMLMYFFLKFPGECILGSCSAETEAFAAKRQDCGTMADWEIPWFAEPPGGHGQLNWTTLLCGPEDGSYFRQFLPKLPACAPSNLTSVASVKHCLITAEMSGDLGYCSLAPSNPALHQFQVSSMYMSWHREVASTGMPAANAVVMGFSFGVGKS